MDPVSAFTAEVISQIRAARTRTSQGVVTAVNGAQVSFRIGTDPTSVVGRWVGATAPKVGDVVTFLDEGDGFPLVFGPTGKDALGTLYEWATYAPTWTCQGTVPNIGNGSLVGRYAKASQWVMVDITLKAGFSTSYGSGAMQFGLPVPAANNGDVFMIEGHLSDFGIGWASLRGMIPAAGNYVTPLFHYNAGALVGLAPLTATNPIALGDADVIRLNGIYRTV